jgi:hypothetical protein
MKVALLPPQPPPEGIKIANREGEIGDAFRRLHLTYVSVKLKSAAGGVKSERHNFALTTFDHGTDMVGPQRQCRFHLTLV